MLTDDEKIQAIGSVLNDPARPMKERFRALFTLKNLGGKKAIDCIVEGFSDSSALLKHECAYCLGQMQDPYAVTYLINVLKDGNQEPMVRHEAGEALGAIGNPDVLDLLKSYCNDPVPEVAETCQLAVKRLQWLTDSKKHEDNLTSNPFTSVDPAPPSTELDIGLLQKKLTDETLPLFDRYRAMFSLRNIGTEKAIKALASGLECNDSALFRHEVAFVLGQLQHEAGVPFLKKRLDSLEENEMVRHECAEALGAVASAQCQEILKKYLSDEKRVVRESCEVALDMCDYENSNEFQYANTLLKI